MATLRRRLNRSLVIQEAHNTAVIDGEDLTISWQCIGYCRSDRETSIEFSIDADNNIPFDEMDCFAYDLQQDWEKRHRIRPILAGPDGISKKLVVPFLAPLTSGEPFDVLLTCALPGCMKAGVDYYTASISFAQDDVLRYELRLVFLGDGPSWLRVYETGALGTVRLLKDLRPEPRTAEGVEYLDIEGTLTAKSVRIYVFARSAPLRQHDEHLAASAVGSA